MSSRKIQSALISVYYKDGLAPIAQLLHQQGVTIYSTGGTQTFLQDLNIPVIPVEELTSYPSILGGRVKTLHPKVFGGILHRRDEASDLDQVKQYEIPSMDLVIVDLYPFEETVASGASEEDIIEKIDIGGISLIRAAAKNYKDVVIVSSREQYATLEQILREKNGETELTDRKHFAAQAFDITSHYDTAIFNYFNQEETIPSLKISERQSQTLRYGENPHQRGWFHGDLNAMFDQLHGKELSYNNLLDIDAAVLLIDEFKGETAYAILKHNNACGIAVDPNPTQAYLKALASDPVSAFGGVIITTTEVDIATAEELNKLFFEVLIAPSFSQSAFELLTTKKNRILLKKKDVTLPKMQVRTVLNGIMRQDRDAKMETVPELRTVTDKVPTEAEKEELIFAAKICKHTKSNTIVLSRDKQLIASGVGQTSRVDALKQAIEKARSFGFDLQGAVMASDAFFPFADCVEIAHGAGITAVIQPGGSIRDQDSIDFCNQNGMAMVTTGIRHFKH
ncbi:bifunctional phosphoribosylaminoimidazolecarboxamide formyltransferase/IMP cyclohydrolase [Cytophagaceae bacterium YF14B1]|uniref:Bifunctional purine biosynthesis protein PurH n=1 Tax=Xanthocytophaga flava TaxID=3048013 RepID=A0AAE3U621_9BACT|nr:bifunctional phosphoribosylaminoimidazolecarboxamide formyltransferase/IMP cyclohydrolase [Xanthocytophaga flavus]MDJ1480092.1 bifunctional phosphoribosylaminoimidazolecarboxamide formyltransferase/IMP cyclohydrolase [Xanthocytophaga flavus]